MLSILNIIIFLVIIFFFSGYIVNFYNDVTYITSDINQKDYLVRDLKNSRQAANMLAMLSNKLELLVNHLNKNKDTEYKEYKEYIEQLDAKFNDIVYSETPGNSEHTSYSVNKGDQLVFCLRSKKYFDQLHDLNLVLYVALHEISHVACPEYGHTPLFKDIFHFFTKTAVKIGIYSPIQFKNNPQEYCGMTITESII